MFTLAQTASVDVNLTLPGIVALTAGILVLVLPKFLNYVVGAYLVIVGVIMIFDITV